jgi:signal transduction histidine kinase
MPSIEVGDGPAATSSEVQYWVAALAAAVSHEINNPLTVVVGHLQLLVRTHTLDPDGHARVSAALAAAMQIAERIRRFARITRLELAAGDPNPPMLDIETPSPEDLD